MNNVADNSVQNDVFFGNDTPLDLGNPPAMEDIPMEAYQNYDVNAVSDEDNSDLAIHNALGALTPADLESPPAEFFNNANNMFEGEDIQTPISKFLLDQIAVIDQDAKSKDPNAEQISLETTFPKNLQTQWFMEFNQAASGSEDPHMKLVSKANGYFFKANETPEDAIRSFNIPENQIAELAQHFQMSYFGTTRSRTKNNNNKSNGFKSFVMHLRDPKNPAGIEALNTVLAAKAKVVEEKLSKSYDLNKATQHLSAKAEGIIAEEIANTGVKPFVGSNDRLFLSPAGVRAEINENAPELKGLYNIEVLNAKGNKVTYSGYSEGLESYFEDELKICKLTTKDPQKLPQAELERIVSEKLSLDQNLGHVASTPQEALIQQIENLSNGPENAPAPKVGSPDAPLSPNDGVKNNFAGKGGFKNNAKDEGADDESHFNRRARKKQNEDEKEPNSLAKMALEAFSKVTQATLAALLALVKLILQTLMMLLKGLLGMASPNGNGQSVLPDNPWATFTNTLNRWNSNTLAANEVENTKDLDPKEALADLTKALDKEIEADQKLKDEFELSGVKPLDKIALSKDELANLTAEDRARLEQDADKLFKNLSDEEKQNYINKITIPALHGFADNIASKLSEPLIHDDRFGVLLASADRVNFEGNEYGVVSAAVVGGALLYAIAKENNTGNYDIEFAPASELTLTEHNAFRFDNFLNLKNHIHEQLVEKFAEHEGKIEKIALVDRENLTGNEISISELNERVRFIDFNQLGYDTAPISIDELTKDNVELSKALYYSVPQLHQDKTGDLASPTKNGSHPFFGRLLDVNDLVEVQLTNSDINVIGSVVGAYEAESDLYYQIYHDNQFYAVKADSVSLIKPNGGDLTSEQISLMSEKSNKAKEFMVGSIAARHEGLATKIDLLTQNDEQGFNQSLQYVLHNDVINQGRSNIGVVPLERNENGDYLGAGKMVSLVGYNKEKTHFVTIGEAVNPDTGMRRAVAIQVENTLSGLRPISAANNRMVQLDLDDPNINIESAGFRNQNIKDFALKARDLYQNGALRRVATVMASFANQAKEQLLAKDNEPLSIARESYVQNKIAMGLLQEQAGIVATIPEINMGLNANLAQSVFHVDEVLKAVENPQSLNFTPSQSLATTQPADLLVHLASVEPQPKFEALNINELISNYSAIEAGVVANAVYTPELATEAVGQPETPEISYQGVNLNQLSVVRVQRGIDGITVEDGKVVLQHKMESADSVRNTMHFALNGHVQDHAYGRFNDAGFALIAGLNATANENAISGLGAADTWFHAKEGKIVLPGATIIAPDSAELPEGLLNSGIKVIQYPAGSTPEEMLNSRNKAIAAELVDRNSPQFDINMHNWNGVDFSNDDQVAISKHFGYETALPSNHSSSPDGELERDFGSLGMLYESKAAGEHEILNTNNGQWYRVDDRIADITSSINSQLNLIENESVRQHYMDALDKFTVKDNPSTDFVIDLDSIKNPEAQNLAVLAGAYITGQSEEVEHVGLLEIMSEKDRLGVTLNSIKADMNNLNHLLNTALGNEQSSDLIQFGALNAHEIDSIKSALAIDDNALRLSNLREAITDYSLDFGDHINAVADQLQQASQSVVFDSLEETEKKALHAICDTMKDGMLVEIEQLAVAHNYTTTADYMHRNENTDLYNAVPESTNQKASELTVAVNAINSVFTGIRPQSPQSPAKEMHLDTSLDNMH